MTESGDGIRFDWRRGGAAAAAFAAMLILLAMNSVAIWLRNRYEQKW